MLDERATRDQHVIRSTLAEDIMARKLVASTLAAVALAAIMIAPSVADAQPSYLICLIDRESDPVNTVNIPITDSMRVAIAECRAQGGHPWGVIVD